MIICHAHSAGAAIRLALSLSMPITSGAVLNADTAIALTAAAAMAWVIKDTEKLP